MRFEKVKLSTIPQAQRSSSYSGLHDAILSMPFISDEPTEQEGITVTFDTEKEETNARNSVRGFSKSHKTQFTLKTEKLGKDASGAEIFGFLIKKFAPMTAKEVAGQAKTVPSANVPA